MAVHCCSTFYTIILFQPFLKILVRIRQSLLFPLEGAGCNKAIAFLLEKKKYMKYVTVLAGIIMLLSGGYMIRDASHTIIAGKNLEQDTIDSQEGSEDIMERLFTTDSNRQIVLSDYQGQYIFHHMIEALFLFFRKEFKNIVRSASNDIA